MTRQEANIAILNLLIDAVNKHSDVRFYQLLVNFGIDDTHLNYNEEPVETLRKIKLIEWVVL